jgi:hypothetical protein
MCYQMRVYMHVHVFMCVYARKRVAITATRYTTSNLQRVSKECTQACLSVFPP